MSKQPLRRLHSKSNLLTALATLLLLDSGTGAVYGQQTAKPEDLPPNGKPAGQEFASRGQRAAREIKYSDWRKFCFKVPGTSGVCRTTIIGTFETGQSAVRIDVIEREGDRAARLQMFLPVASTCRLASKSPSIRAPPIAFPTFGVVTIPASRPILLTPTC